MNNCQEKNIPIANIGERVKSLRESKGLSQAQFAEKIGVKQAFISKIESNTASFTVEHIILLKNVFGVDLNRLLTCEGNAVVAEESPAYRKADPRIAALTANFEALSEADKKAIERIAATLAQSQKAVKRAG